MRAVFILAAAVPLGLAAGYAWSAWPGQPAHFARSAAVEPKAVDLPQSAADTEWHARSNEQGTPPLEARPDPTAVEQSVYYTSCKEAWAAGTAPVHAGQPGYRTGLDGDGDGIACEPFHA